MGDRLCLCHKSKPRSNMELAENAIIRIVSTVKKNNNNRTADTQATSGLSISVALAMTFDTVLVQQSVKVLSTQTRAYSTRVHRSSEAVVPGFILMLADCDAVRTSLTDCIRF